eukprot:gene4091-5839_t
MSSFSETSSYLLLNAFDLNISYGLLHRDEVLCAVEAVKKIHHSELLQFISVSFYEVSKDILILSAIEQKSIGRKVEVISICLENNTTYVDIVSASPSDATVEKQTTTDLELLSKDYFKPSLALKDVQAGISPDEYALVEVLCKTYQPLLDVVAKRGLDPQWVVADAWCLGYTGPECDPSERVCWPSLYYFDQTIQDLPYSRPIDGIEVIISLTQKKIIYFNDKEFIHFPIPKADETNANYVHLNDCRSDIKPLSIVQANGPSWKISKFNTIEWQKWKFQIGFNSREGLTLHGLSFDSRLVLHRLSLCEMVVPYGDPRSPHCKKNAFDAGEDGLGRNANSLVLGCDCLGLIHYFDANLVSDNGDLCVIKNAICMHEEDNGIAWKHTDWRTAVPFVRRSRKLILSFVCTIANYEYGFYFILSQDGAIEVEAKLTGVLSTGALSYEEQPDGKRKYGTNLGGCLYAPVHQHFFVAKIDFAVDGCNNSVVELNAFTESEGSHNPDNNGFYYEETLLTTEKEAIRDCNTETARYWKVINPTIKNTIGSNTGYKIVPGMPIKPFAKLLKSSRLKRAAFLDHQLWITPSNPLERYPGGEFPNQQRGIDGLPIWTNNNRSIVNTEIVAWFVFGVTHNPRPEDWPVMPVEKCSFHLKPSGFFDRSPVMDLPDSITSNQHNNENCCDK